MKNIFEQPHRDPERISPMLARIEELWKKCPDIRLGQLISNATSDRDNGIDPSSTYYMEDDVLLAKLEAMYKDIDKQD